MEQACIFILLLFVAVSNTVPLTNQRKRFKREEEISSTNTNTTIPVDVCVLDNEIYEHGQNVPSLGPCEKCVCEAPDVVCSMIKCQANSGCRTIQQSGQCCPEYKCDCEHNGQVYNNGERLDKPEDPCQVCYCKGGEIMCTSITCYERDDCKPLYTPGQCCPKYDHCPVENSRASGNSVRSVNTSLYSPKREMQPWPLTRPSNTPTSASYDESSALPNVYPQTIRIVEILPTTPGPVKKPSEVSLFPRIKTNDPIEATEIAKVVSSSSESTTESSSSTSEVEHLLDTTPETRDVKNELTTAGQARLSSTTLNPLAEIVDPNTLPDSNSFSTIFPNYYYTEGSLNSVDDETTRIWNEPEGSGYELLTGGIYEEISSLPTLLNDEESSTEKVEPAVNLTNGYIISNQEINEDENPSNVSSVETSTEKIYTVETEAPLVSEEFDNNNTGVEHKCDECNTKIQDGSLNSASSSEKESIESFEESSEELQDKNSSNETIIETENLNNQTLIALDENSPNSKHNISNESSERLIDERKQADEALSTTLEPSVSTIAEVSSVLYDNSSTAAIESVSNITTNENGNEISTITEDDSTVSTEPSEFHSVSQVPDETSTLEQTERKRVSLGNYRNLDSIISTRDYLYDSKEQVSEKTYSSTVEDTSTSPSSLSFPTVLNVHTLDYSEMTPQIENTTTHNTSSMAKVGIYHPTKPNEFASYLTVVDDKNNVSSVSEEAVSSHILLTPNDLKKLAEILIHEKIKPAFPETSTEKNETDTTETYRTSESSRIGNYKSSTASYRNLEEIEKEIPYRKNYGLDEATNSEENTSQSMEGTVTSLDLNKYSIQNVSGNTATLNERSTTSLPDIIEQSTLASSTDIKSSKEVILSPDEVVKNFVTTISGNKKVVNNVANDDPNTSRQIRIPENGDQYTALLDDKDLLILEDFFKKNMGLH